MRCPRFAALAAALVGLVNIASALTPNIRWRGHLLLGFEPVEAMRLFHALALPAGAALLLVAPYLLKRRRRALAGGDRADARARAVRPAQGARLRGDDLTWGVGGHPDRRPAARSASATTRSRCARRSGACRCSALAGLAAAGAGHLGLAGPPVVRHGRHARRAICCAGSRARSNSHHPPSHFAWIPLGVHLVELGTLLAIAYVIFRPLAAPRRCPSPAARAARRRAGPRPRHRHAVVLQAPRRQALLLQPGPAGVRRLRIENGVLLLSGDPVGPPRRVRRRCSQLRAFADARGLKLGAVGASERLCPLYEELGLRTIYLGDEAVIELGRFSLEGRPIRKVRQSVTRLSKAGYRPSCTSCARSTRRRSSEVEDVSSAAARARRSAASRWRWTRSRASTTTRRWWCWRATSDGAIRGVLHFVPCYGRPAVSLSFMRRDPATPNGLTEFLVVRGGRAACASAAWRRCR